MAWRAVSGKWHSSRCRGKGAPHCVVCGKCLVGGKNRKSFVRARNGRVIGKKTYCHIHA